MTTLDPRLLEAFAQPFSSERFRTVVDATPRAPIWITRALCDRALAADGGALVRAVVLDGARDAVTRAAALAALDDAVAPLGDPAIAAAAEALLGSDAVWARLHVLWWLCDHPRAEVAEAVARLLGDTEVASDMDATWRVANEAAIALAALPSLLPPLQAALDRFVDAERRRLGDGNDGDRELAAATLKALADRCAFTSD